MTTPLVVSPKDAARLLSVGRTTVYKLIDSGELPVVHFGAARVVRIPVAAIENYIDRNTTEARR